MNDSNDEIRMTNDESMTTDQMIDGSKFEDSSFGFYSPFVIRHSSFHRLRRGFVVMMALVLLALMSVALVALATLFAAQVRRTHWAAEEAQLRQLLHAGATAALAQPPGDGPIALPADLDDDGAAVELAREGDWMRISAALRSRELEQVVRIEQVNGVRRVAAVEHGPQTAPR